MSKNVVTPRSVSFEDALRNLAGRLTGRPAAGLPRTQENIVQFMAENMLSVDELVEAVTSEVIARLSAEAPSEEPAQEQADTTEQVPHNGLDVSGSIPAPDEEEKAGTGDHTASDKRRNKSKAEKAE